MAGVKVYGWTGFRTAPYLGSAYHGQTWEVMAARSWAEVARASGMTVHYLRQYGGTTANPEDLAAARSRPGVVLWRPLDERRGEYVPASEPAR